MMIRHADWKSDATGTIVGGPRKRKNSRGEWCDDYTVEFDELQKDFTDPLHGDHERSYTSSTVAASFLRPHTFRRSRVSEVRILESKNRRYSLSTLMLITTAVAALSLYVENSNRYALVGLIGQLIVIVLCYQRIRLRKPTFAILIFSLYVALWAGTAVVGTTALIDLYIGSGFSQVESALRGPGSTKGLCTFGNTCAVCPFVISVEETAVSPIGSHGGYSGTACWLWTPIGRARLHTWVECSRS